MGRCGTLHRHSWTWPGSTTYSFTGNAGTTNAFSSSIHGWTTTLGSTGTDRARYRFRCGGFFPESGPWGRRGGSPWAHEINYERGTGGPGYDVFCDRLDTGSGRGRSIRVVLEEAP